MNHILFDNDSKHLDRFGLLLVVTVLAIVGQMLFNQNLDEASLQRTLVATVVNTLVALALLLSIRAAGLRRRWTRIADILVGIGLVALLLIVIVELSTNETGPAITITSPSTIVVVLALFSPIAVVWRLGQHRKVTMATLLGAVSGFLLIANAFNFAFRALDSVTSTPFFGSVEPTTVYMYFSLVTVTTTGYGDFAPVTQFGRLLATTEAILGQVYLVTVVAMAVGLYAQQQVSARRQLASDQDPGTATADPSLSD